MIGENVSHTEMFDILQYLLKTYRAYHYMGPSIHLNYTISSEQSWGFYNDARLYCALILYYVRSLALLLEMNTQCRSCACAYACVYACGCYCVARRVCVRERKTEL